MIYAGPYMAPTGSGCRSRRLSFGYRISRYRGSDSQSLSGPYINHKLQTVFPPEPVKRQACGNQPQTRKCFAGLVNKCHDDK